MTPKVLEDIPTALFNLILQQQLERGWLKRYEYGGMDAWIDYGLVELEKDGRTLIFEWNNWWEGSISGPFDLLSRIREEHGLPWSQTVGSGDE